MKVNNQVDIWQGVRKVDKYAVINGQVMSIEEAQEYDED